MYRSFLTRGVIAVTLSALPALALAEIIITDPYARASRPGAPTGAAFMEIVNSSDTADRLIAATSDVAKKVELHTHIENDEGVMKMVEIEGGIEIPAGGTHTMRRGGDHVMFMGLNETLEQDGEVIVTLTFEQAGDVTISIPVDNERQPKHGAMKHANTDHSVSN